MNEAPRRKSSGDGLHPFFELLALRNSGVQLCHRHMRSPLLESEQSIHGARELRFVLLSAPVAQAMTRATEKTESSSEGGRVDDTDPCLAARAGDPDSPTSRAIHLAQHVDPLSVIGLQVATVCRGVVEEEHVGTGDPADASGLHPAD